MQSWALRKCLTVGAGAIDSRRGAQELLQWQGRLPVSTPVCLIIGASVEAPVGYTSGGSFLALFQGVSA